MKIIWAIRLLLLSPFLGSVGKYSYLGKPIILKNIKNLHIGSRVRIYPNNRFEVYGDGKIIIKDNTSIGQGFHCTSNSNDLVIGENTTISGNVFITNIDHNYQEIDKHILKQNHIVLETRIGENCFIGYGAAIQAGTVLGKQCVVGANSVVRGVFPDYCVIVGAPARVVKRYNTSTMKWEKV